MAAMEGLDKGFEIDLKEFDNDYEQLCSNSGHETTYSTYTKQYEEEANHFNKDICTPKRDYETVSRKSVEETPYSTFTKPDEENTKGDIIEIDKPKNDYEKVRRKSGEGTTYSTYSKQGEKDINTEIGIPGFDNNSRAPAMNSLEPLVPLQSSCNRKKTGVIAAISVGLITIISISVVVVITNGTDNNVLPSETLPTTTRPVTSTATTPSNSSLTTISNVASTTPVLPSKTTPTTTGPVTSTATTPSDSSTTTISNVASTTTVLPSETPSINTRPVTVTATTPSHSSMTTVSNVASTTPVLSSETSSTITRPVTLTATTPSHSSMTTISNVASTTPVLPSETPSTNTRPVTVTATAPSHSSTTTTSNVENTTPVLSSETPSTNTRPVTSTATTPSHSSTTTISNVASITSVLSSETPSTNTRPVTSTAATPSYSSMTTISNVASTTPVLPSETPPTNTGPVTVTAATPSHSSMTTISHVESTTLVLPSETPSTNTRPVTSTATTPSHSSTTTISNVESTTVTSGNNSYQWSLWGEWTQCTASCDTGIHTRYRHCIEELSSLCLGDYVETELCAEINCPAIGKWTTWSFWGSCNVTCGGGSHIRNRICIKSDEFDKDCTGESFQQKACNDWSCPDCNQTCTKGVLNDRCDTCICDNNNITGRILAKATANPVIGAGLYSRTAPTQLIALSNSTGFFSLNATCTESELYITKEGFIDTLVTINDTFIEINLTRIVKPFLTEVPQSKYRLPNENVTFCCKASANPKIKYFEWFKDSILLDKEMYSNETQLTLAYLSGSDSGNYQCRANNDRSAILSPAAELIVKDEPDDFCSDALQQKTIMLPDECMQPGSSTSVFEVGDCLTKKCRLNNTKDGGTCGEDTNYCCSAKEYNVETINCTYYELDVIVIKSCGCAICTPSEALISGVVTGLEDKEPVPFASVYLNGELKDYTTTTGSFEISANITTSRWTITILDDFYENYLPASKVIDVSNDLSGLITVNIKMIRASEPIEINSAFENTIQAGSSNGTNVLLSIPANAFSYQNGSEFTGTVKSRLTYLDPSNLSNIEHIPGVFQYVDSEGVSGDLESLGVFNLYFEDRSGQPVVTNQAIDAYIPIAEGDNRTYETFKLWTLNTQTGIWELEEDSIENTGSRKRRQRNDAWVGALSDISTRKWYNYDGVYRLTDNQCFFKIRVFRDLLFRETIDSPSDTIYIRTNIIRGRTLHTIQHYTRDPKRYCVNVPCDNEISYITGRTNKQTLFIGQPYPSAGTAYWISSDRTVLKAQMTSSSNGPFHSSKKQCFASSNTDAYLSFSYGITNFQWRFREILSRCEPRIEQLIRQRYWYPYHKTHGYRVCFVKIKIHFQTGVSIGERNEMKIRVFSFGGADSKINDMILGIHESKVDDSNTYCIEYRCSGFIDPCDESVFDYTKVRIILEYPVRKLRCTIDDIATGIKVNMHSYLYYWYLHFDTFQFAAPYDDGNEDLGIYTNSHVNTDPNVAVSSAQNASKRYCKAGTFDPNDKSKLDSGYAVSFKCERL